MSDSGSTSSTMAKTRRAAIDLRPQPTRRGVLGNRGGGRGAALRRQFRAGMLDNWTVPDSGRLDRSRLRPVQLEDEPRSKLPVGSTIRVLDSLAAGRLGMENGQ